jgi:uncharacterized protein YkvS
MNKVQTAIAEIRNMNNDELNQVIAAIKLQRTWLAKTTARALAVGDLVEFKGRYGNTERGRVQKINPKTVIVDAGHTRWKVTASLLKVVEAA